MNNKTNQKIPKKNTKNTNTHRQKKEKILKEYTTQVTKKR